MGGLSSYQIKGPRFKLQTDILVEMSSTSGQALIPIIKHEMNHIISFNTDRSQRNNKNPIKDLRLQPSQGKQKGKVKERPKEAQPIGPKKREKANLFRDRKSSHPWPLKCCM